MNKPVATHNYGTDFTGAFAHAHRLAAGGWAVRTSRVNGQWTVTVMEYTK